MPTTTRHHQERRDSVGTIYPTIWYTDSVKEGFLIYQEALLSQPSATDHPIPQNIVPASVLSADSANKCL